MYCNESLKSGLSTMLYAKILELDNLLNMFYDHVIFIKNKSYLPITGQYNGKRLICES